MYKFPSTVSYRSVRRVGSSSSRMRQEASGTSLALGTSLTRTPTPERPREPPEREVQAPLDVRAEGSVEIRAFDANVDIHFPWPLLFSRCSFYRANRMFGQLETLFVTIR
jgi:hypothetical protein